MLEFQYAYSGIMSALTGGGDKSRGVGRNVGEQNRGRDGDGDFELEAKPEVERGLWGSLRCLRHQA